MFNNYAGLLRCHSSAQTYFPDISEMPLGMMVLRFQKHI